MAKFQNITDKLSEYLEKLNNKDARNPLKKAFLETRHKILGLQKKYNDDNRYLLINTLDELKREKNISFDITEKQYLIDNKIVIGSQKGDDNNLFRFNGEYFKPNLNIKPTIQKEFQKMVDSYKPVEKFAQYIHENFRNSCSIYDADGGTSFATIHRSNNKLDKKGTLWWGYETGGADGGNCWGGEPQHYSVDEKPKKDFPPLKEFLKDMVPDITFLDYDELREIIKSDDFREREYYGNHTDYYIEYIEPDKLYKKLNDMGYDLESRFSKKNKKDNGLQIKHH
jgi:hypothetical protein